MNKLLIYYNFIIVSLLVISGFFNAQNYLELVKTAPLLPLAIYFGLFIFPRRRKAIVLPKKKTINKSPAEKQPVTIENDTLVPADEGEVLKKEGVDSNRRMFLKLIGSAGLSVFFFAIFTKKAEAAFFGSVPGPGTMALKNTAGEKIDPAEKQPTDGYRIARVDDSTPSYYGYINKDGGWFIMQEEDNGTYKYARGNSDFLTDGWNVRNTTLEYFDFDEIF